MFENVDGRTTDARVTGILLAQPCTFGSGELKIKTCLSHLFFSKKWLEKHLFILLALFSDFLPAHPSSFTYNFFSEMQSFYFSESQDAIILQSYHEK